MSKVFEFWKDGFKRLVERDYLGRFVTWRLIPFFWRVSVTLNFVESNNYLSALLQKWFDSKEEAYNNLPEIKEELISRVERYLGYERNVWWFDAVIGQGIQDFQRKGRDYFNIGNI